MNDAVLEEKIRLCAKQLKVPGFADYTRLLRQAETNASFGELLLELMTAECAIRQDNQMKRRLKAAAFPYQKTLDEFDYSQLNPSVSPLFLQELASCQFLKNKQNVIFIGNPGRGKTHLSIALGLKACQAGFRVLFKNAAALSTELCEARDRYSLGKLERTLAKAGMFQNERRKQQDMKLKVWYTDDVTSISRVPQKGEHHVLHIILYQPQRLV